METFALWFVMTALTVLAGAAAFMAGLAVRVTSDLTREVGNLRDRIEAVERRQRGAGQAG
jgi:hypothetical protein